MKGTRVDTLDEVFGENGVNGGYFKGQSDGEDVWFCRTPNGHLGTLSRHTVVEHEDSTITVSPSILVSDGTGELWHGFLENGIWREC